MYLVETFLEHYGMLFLVLVGFAEFIGMPLAAAPVLLIVGAASRSTGVPGPAAAMVAVSMGAIVAELVWFGIARWQGQRLVGFGCGLGANPSVCVDRFNRRLAAGSTAALFFAKFIPGSGAVPALAAGLSQLPWRRFLWTDSIALLVWSGAYLGLGWLLGEQVEAIVEWALQRSEWMVVIVLLVIASAAVWRWVKARRHSRMHDPAYGSSPDPRRSRRAVKGSGYLCCTLVGQGECPLHVMRQYQTLRGDLGRQCANPRGCHVVSWSLSLSNTTCGSRVFIPTTRGTTGNQPASPVRYPPR